MPRTYKICSPHLDRSPARRGSSLDQVAADERVDNARIMMLPGNRSRSGTSRAAVERMKLWENGRTLRVRFLDGLPEVQTKVAAIAQEWEALTNLRLNFVNSGAAQIRISFREQGFSWSTVGTDALGEPASSPTMNYGWLEPTTSLREYQRVVRHEFGHALGMIHEHQNPAAAGVIPWDRPKVYAHYAQQGWDRDDVDFNIFQVYADDSTNHSTFDPTSIMQYAVPDSLTIGTYAIGWNTTFSPTDVEFMARQYPKGSPGTVELAVGGPLHVADLALGAEVDTYHVDIAAAATYIMTTQGSTDTVLTLHGPGDPGAIVAWDNDRGQGLNARIVRKLQPGSYWLTVRHQQPGGTGTYTVGITKRK